MAESVSDPTKWPKVEKQLVFQKENRIYTRSFKGMVILVRKEETRPDVKEPTKKKSPLWLSEKVPIKSGRSDQIKL